MKRKLSFLLMPFLALGLFGAVHAAKDENVVVAKAATQLINIERASIGGAGVEVFLADKPNVQKTDFKIEVTSFKGEGAYAGYTLDNVHFERVDDYNPGNGRLYFLLNMGFDPGVAYFEWTFFIEYTDANGTFNGSLFFERLTYQRVDGPIVNLGAPTDASINGNILTFTAGNNAESHSVQYLKNELVMDTETDVVSPHTLKGLNDGLEVGTYNVQVCSHMGEETSEWVDAGLYVVASMNAEKLANPENVHVVDGMLEFDAVENAAYYLVEYVKDGSTVATENAEKSPYELNKDLKAGVYNIRVTAMNGDNHDYTPSDYVEAPEVFEIELVAVELTVLDIWNFHGGAFASVRFAAWDTAQFNMSDVSYFYINKYRETDYRPDGDAFIMKGFYDEGKEEKYVFKFYNAEDMLLAQATYSREVILPSEPVKLSAPEGLVIHPAEGTLAFTGVTNASGYHVQYRQEGEVKYEHDITNGGLLNPDKNYAAGVYDIFIKTLGDGEYYLDSDYVTAGAFVISRDAEAEANAFIAKWRGLFVSMQRAAQAPSICEALNSRTEEVKALIDEYDALDAEVKEIVDNTVLDDLGITSTFAEHMAYVKSYIDYGTASADENVLNTMLVGLTNNDTTSLVALFAILGLIAVSAYYFIEKKKIAK